MVLQFNNTSAIASTIIFGVDTHRKGCLPAQQNQVEAVFIDQIGTIFTDRVGEGGVSVKKRGRLVNLDVQLQLNFKY